MKKTAKKERLPTRKRRALKRIAIAALTVFCINHFMHIGLLFPIQAIRQAEERKGAGWTRVVDRTWEPELHKTHLLYLTENENTTMLASTYLTVYGWMAGFSLALDCSENAPLYAGQRYMSYEEGALDYIFGRVDDPEIERIEVLFQGQTYASETEELGRKTLHTIVSSREEWLEKEGRDYFLMKSDYDEWPEDMSPFYTALIAYDGAGNVVFQMDIEQKSFSYYG